MGAGSVASTRIIERTDGNVRVIEMSEPRANLLTLELRTQLLEALQRSCADASIEATVLIGRGSCFSGGMDLDALDDDTALQPPSLHAELLDQLSEMNNPVVAAIHGAAHGGGLELALGCHYRIACDDAVLSQPEILVGLMPGARGTQHLSRAVGIDAAADLILTGRRLTAVDAPAGLLDRLVGSDLLCEAIDFARAVSAIRPIPRLQDNVAAPATVDVRSHLTAQTAGLPGVPGAIRMLEGATRLPYSAAIRQEVALFRQLANAEASRELRSAFRSRIKADAEARRRRHDSNGPEEDSRW